MSFTTDVGKTAPTSRVATPSIPAARSASGTVTTPHPLGWTTETGGHAPVTIRSRAFAHAPRLRQLMGVCGWAAVLGGVGLVISVRGIWGVIADTPPAWYEPAVTIAGLTGIAFTVSAFLTVQRRRLPWALLTVATAFFGAAMVFTASAF